MLQKKNLLCGLLVLSMSGGLWGSEDGGKQGSSADGSGLLKIETKSKAADRMTQEEVLLATILAGNGCLNKQPAKYRGCSSSSSSYSKNGLFEANRSQENCQASFYLNDGHFYVRPDALESNPTHEHAFVNSRWKSNNRLFWSCLSFASAIGFMGWQVKQKGLRNSVKPSRYTRAGKGGVLTSLGLFIGGWFALDSAREESNSADDSFKKISWYERTMQYANETTESGLFQTLGWNTEEFISEKQGEAPKLLQQYSSAFEVPEVMRLGVIGNNGWYGWLQRKLFGFAQKRTAYHYVLEIPGDSEKLAEAAIRLGMKPSLIGAKRNQSILATYSIPRPQEPQLVK